MTKLEEKKNFKEDHKRKERELGDKKPAVTPILGITSDK